MLKHPWLELVISTIALLLFHTSDLSAGQATRSVRYWMTHASDVPESPGCVTLLGAVAANGGELALGFLQLPAKDRDQNGVLGAHDTLMEALGLYWRGPAHFSLNDKQSAAQICRHRRVLAVELIAATANAVYLGTSPTNFMQSADVPFPADLLERAREAARGVEPEAMANYIALLRQFNLAGQTNSFEAGLIECQSEDRKALRKLSRNPVTGALCRGALPAPAEK
ncbi:MAG: hypothetical protein WCS70_11640 [Verrucomicrobiota bacterium]